MTVFINVFVNFIEAFCFPFFIAHYFNFNNKIKYIVITCLIQFFILNIFYFYSNNNIVLTISIIITMLISIYIKQKHLLFNHFYITLFYNILIFVVALSALFINNLLSLIYSNNIDFFLFSCLLSRIILFILTLFILKKKFNFSLSLNYKDWYFILCLEFLLLIVLGMVITSIVFNQMNKTFLYFVLFILILISILVIMMIYYIDKTHLAKLELEMDKQRKDFEIKKINTIQNIKNDINAIEHRMFYIFYNTEILLKNHQYEEAYALLEKNRRQTLKYKTIIDTNNIIFDYLFSLKINELISIGVDIKLCIFISQSILYNDLTFINSLNSMLDTLSHSSFISIHITENSAYNIIKISYITQNDIDQNILLKHIQNLDNTFKIKYEFGNKEIGIVIQKDDYEIYKELF